MRIILIGGSGFIGSFLAPELMRRGADVAILSRGLAPRKMLDGLTWITGDRNRLSDAIPSLRTFGPDVIIDLVLSSGAQATATMDVARGIARRVVAISSIDVYRACGILHGLEEGPLEPVPLVESSPLRTKLATYPASQIAMLKQVFGWVDDEYDKIPVERAILSDSKVPGTVLRLPMIYGPGDPLHRLWPLVKRMEDGRRTIILDEGLATWRGPRGYVENVAAAIALAALDPRASHRVYNVAEEHAYTELEWAQAVAKAAGWAGEFVVLPAEHVPVHLRIPGNFRQHWTTDSTRIRRELGYLEMVDPAEGIRRTIAWERANPPERAAMPIDHDAEDAAVAAASR